MNKKSQLSKIENILMITSLLSVVVALILFSDLSYNGMTTNNAKNGLSTEVINQSNTTIIKEVSINQTNNTQDNTSPIIEQPINIEETKNQSNNLTTSGGCSNIILSSSNADYTFNCTTGIITSIYDKLASKEILDMNSAKGCGWAINNGTDWLPSSAVTPYGSDITIIYSDSRTLTFQKAYSQINTIMSYYIAHDVLFIDTNFTSPNDLSVYNGSTVRYICDINDSYLDDKRVFPWDTIATTSVASQGDVNSFTSKTFYSDTSDTGNLNYIYVNDKITGFIFALMMPTGNGGLAGSNFEQSIKIDKSAVDMPLQFRQSSIDLNSSNTPINLAFTIANNLQALNNIYYNSQSSAYIDGAWLTTCYETSILNYNSFVEAYNKGARFWNMNCWLPDSQILPHDGSSWYPKFFYGNAANISYLNHVAGLAKSAGIEPYLYYTAAELNQTTANTYYPGDISINSSDGKIISTYADLPRYYMTFDNKTGWYANASNDISYLINNVPNISGIFMDINGVREADYNSTDYNYYWNIDKQVRFTFIQYGYNDFINNIDNILDASGKKLIINGPHQALLAKYSVGLTEDTDNLARIPGNKLISLGKPVYMIPIEQNQSYLMNDSVLWGVRPALSFYYLNISPQDNYTSFELMLSNTVASDQLLNFFSDETAHVYYVEYNHTLTSEASTINYTRSNPKDFIRLNDNRYLATNTTSLNTKQLNDGYTNVILMNDPSGCTIFSNESILNYNYTEYYCNNTVINYTISYNLLNITALDPVIINLTSLSAKYPNNDVKNVSNDIILASNANNLSITLQPNQKIEIGNYTNKSGPPIDNTTIVNETTPPVSPSSSGSSGGGGGVYTPLVVNATQNVTQNVSENVTENVSNISENISKNAAANLPVVESPVEIKQPIKQQPKVINSYLVLENVLPYILLIVIAIFLSILISTKRKEAMDPTIEQFIKSALNAGYEYSAIRIAMSKIYSQSVIDEHFKMVRLQNINPIIRVKYPIDKSRSKVEELKAYIMEQRLEGFKDKDIENVLLHYGHGKQDVKEAFIAFSYKKP